MRLVDAVCPRCGANLKIDSEREKAFCEHCGAEILIDDEVQHIKYDNAEQAGYEFEKGRQRAQKEAMKENYGSHKLITNTCEKKKNTWLWVLGWICFFPIPIMALVWRKKNTWDIKTKIIVTVLFWVLLFAAGSILDEPSEEDENVKTEEYTVSEVEDNISTKSASIENTSSDIGNNTEKVSDDSLDLTGLWVQEKHSESYMAATIRKDGLIGVFFILDGDETPYTYWVGTYDTEAGDKDKCEWVSESTYAGNGILASSDNTKNFTYDSGKIKFNVVLQGESKDVTLVRGDWDVSKIPDSAFGSVKMSNSEYKSIEIKDSGWYVSKYGYLMYYVTLYNPNAGITVEFPSYRITARDENGALIDTDEMTLSVIYPESEISFGSQAFNVDVDPSSVEFEMIEPQEYKLKRLKENEGHKPLEVVNAAARSNKIVGEVYNPNDYAIDTVRVMAVCKNEAGEVVSITSEFIKNVKAGENTPFSLSCSLTDNVASTMYYANEW